MCSPRHQWIWSQSIWEGMQIQFMVQGLCRKMNGVFFRGRCLVVLYELLNLFSDEYNVLMTVYFVFQCPWFFEVLIFLLSKFFFPFVEKYDRFNNYRTMLNQHLNRWFLVKTRMCNDPNRCGDEKTSAKSQTCSLKNFQYFKRTIWLLLWHYQHEVFRYLNFFVERLQKIQQLVPNKLGEWNPIQLS